METAKKRPVLDQAAFRAAVEDLSPNELIRLEKKGRAFAVATGWTGKELLHEAIVRTLGEDGRNCPTDVPVPIFLANAMRSIGEGEREKAAREVLVGAGPGEDDVVTGFRDPAASPETHAGDRMELEQVVAQLEDVFTGDPQAQAIVIGDGLGCSAEEIREMEPMTDTEYATARRRVRRTLERKFGGKKR